MTFLLLALLAVLAYFAVNPSAGNSVTASVESIIKGKLTPAQIAGYASAAGFSGDDLTTAIAVALAESGGDTSVQGDQSLAPTNGPSIGLWQINIGSRAHPELAEVDLTDPQNNANAAFSIYVAAGYSFHPWTTFTSGIYATFIQAASQGIADAGSVA